MAANHAGENVGRRTVSIMAKNWTSLFPSHLSGIFDPSPIPLSPVLLGIHSVSQPGCLLEVAKISSEERTPCRLEAREPERTRKSSLIKEKNSQLRVFTYLSFLTGPKSLDGFTRIRSLDESARPALVAFLILFIIVNPWHINFRVLRG